MNNPKISVCISTHNRSRLLKFAVESVLQQTYCDWELIICDDGSTDYTSEYVSQIVDDRVQYVRHPHNIGKSNNMRSGFEAAKGEYFIKFDDDDRLVNDFLEQTIEILDRCPEVDFVGTDHWIIDINNTRNEEQTRLASEQWGRTTLPEGIVDDLLEIIFIHQSFYIGATLFRREVLQKLGYMRPNLQNCEDIDLFLRLALADKCAYYLPKRLMEYRVHAEQRSLDRAVRFLEDQLDYLQSYVFESKKLEQVQQSRIAQTSLFLGFYLLEVGKVNEGRKLLAEGRSASPLKAEVGMALTLLPSKWQQSILGLRHRLRRK